MRNHFEVVAPLISTVIVVALIATVTVLILEGFWLLRGQGHCESFLGTAASGERARGLVADARWRVIQRLAAWLSEEEAARLDALLRQRSC